MRVVFLAAKRMTGKKGGFMDDLISREKAIEAMEGVDWYHINKDGQLTHGANSKEDEPLYKAEDVYNVLNDMPSAQPEKRTHERTETHTCDLISRQWLMECVNEGWIKFDTEKDENRFIHLVRDIAPSAQPEPVQGGAKNDA